LGYREVMLQGGLSVSPCRVRANPGVASRSRPCTVVYSRQPGGESVSGHMGSG